MSEYPKASKVIAAIQALIDKHGDLPLLLRDPDTKYQMQLGVDHNTPNTGMGTDSEIECFEITGSYHDEPDGFVEP